MVLQNRNTIVDDGVGWQWWLRHGAMVNSNGVGIDVSVVKVRSHGHEGRKGKRHTHT